MTSIYMYAVSYDLGFAPNPFGGLCSLACCKPDIRERAQVGDWIIGLTGTKIPPAMRVVFAMLVTSDMTFDQYWAAPEHLPRRPKRNGTQKKLVGDNIYHRDTKDSPWQQQDSVHSLEDGTQSADNTDHDTRINRVLLSTEFVYFGSLAEALPANVSNELNYTRNARNYYRYDALDARALLEWLKTKIAATPRAVLADPINFDQSAQRYDPIRERMI
jgi:hypothetical protein